MGLVFQVLIIVALLFCESHQLKTRDNGARDNPKPKPGSGHYGYNTGSGPYDIDVHLIHLCEDQQDNRLVDLKLEPYNTKTDEGSKIMYRGNFTTPFTKEEVQKLELKIFVYRIKDSKDFQLLDYNDNMCKSCAGPAKDVFIDVRRVMGLEGDKCDFPPGFYSFQDWEVKIDLPPPVLEYGRYRATIQLAHEGKTFACVKGNGLVKQKI